MGKQIYSWSRVKAGDIISFRYRGKKTGSSTLTTILVLNEKMRVRKKDGTSIFHLIGLVLEKEGVVPHIKNKEELVELLKRIGDITPVDTKNQIFRIELKNPGTWGFKQSSYKKLKRYFEEHGVYRTYIWEEAKNSSVFLEPIALPTNLQEVLGFKTKAVKR